MLDKFTVRKALFPLCIAPAKTCHNSASIDEISISAKVYFFLVRSEVLSHNGAAIDVISNPTQVLFSSFYVHTKIQKMFLSSFLGYSSEASWYFVIIYLLLLVYNKLLRWTTRVTDNSMDAKVNYIYIKVIHSNK